ncbi:GWxTD domain-containing protein [Fidelibacter multiformis]|uniref:GWxTD domain-containing protein n=1 Tax=Fidelibacter multiformis TaxID=3377529 RepID=UPI0037DDD98E
MFSAIFKKSILILISITGVIFGQVQMPFDIDYAVFLGDDETPTLEIYYMTHRSLITYQSDENQDSLYKGGYEIITTLYSRGEPVYQKHDIQNDEVKDPSLVTPKQKIPKILPLQIRPGDYEIKVQIKDIHSGHTGEQKIAVNVPEFPKDSLVLSDIEIASYILNAEEMSHFTKLGRYDVIPHAQRVYNPDNPSMIVYAEIYNLTKTDKRRDKNRYTQVSRVLDMNGQEVMKNKELEIDTPGSFSVVMDKLNVGTLEPGIYTYELQVEDLNTGQTDISSKKFYVMSPQGAMPQKNPLDDIVRNMSAEEVDSIFSILQPVMAKEEIRMYKNSNLEGKQSVLIRFWEARDPDPATPVNEFRIELEKRIQYANDQFSTQIRRGAQTDRGMVLLKYGFPSDREVFPSRMERNPYEIWSYNHIEGGVEFVFVDEMGTGLYELVHSTKRGERYDPDWYERYNYR